MGKYNTIMIGNDYKQAFKSVVELYNNGFISKEFISNIENDNVIVSGDGNTRFIYDPSISSYSVEGELRIDKEGSSWFKTLRDKSEIVYGDNEWIDLLRNVADEYHRKNSFLEFLQIRKEFNSRETDKHIGIINKFFQTFYPESSFYPSTNVRNEDCDIYGVSVAMDVSLVGETQKIIGRIFFKNINGRYYPLDSVDAIDIESQINSLMSSEKSKTSEETKLHDNDIIYNILTEVEKLIEKDSDSEFEKSPFAKSFVYANDKDKEIIDGMLAKGPQDFVTLTCTSLKVLGIFHVKMIYQYYEILHENTVAFKAVFDRNNSFSITCLNCSKNEYIVENNRMYTKDKDSNKILEFNLKSEAENFGFDLDTINYIKENSSLRDHCLAIKHTVGKSVCSKIACLEDTIVYNKKHYCKNCPYPKIIFTDINGVSHVLDSLDFVSDKLCLVSKKDENNNNLTGQCYLCHRTYTLDGLESGICKSCKDALNANKEHLNVYKKYKFMLSNIQRLAKPKFAIEDSQMIIFNVNNKLKYFNKLEIGRTNIYKLKGEK